MSSETKTNSEKSSETIFDQKFYKLTNEAGAHHGYKFYEGLNVDVHEWNDYKCSQGGFYLTTLEDMARWFEYSDQVGQMVYVWDAKIAPDSPFSYEAHKVKAHRILLSNRRRIEDLPEWKDPAFQLSGFYLNAGSFRYIKEPIEEVQLLAVQKTGSYIQQIKNPSEAVQIAAVEQLYINIGYIKAPSKAVQLAALRKHVNAYGYIENPCQAAADEYTKQICGY